MTTAIPLESENIEYKRELPKGEKLAREIIAFANTRGGRIVIGYDEKSQEYFDSAPDQRTEEKIANIVSDLCQPRVPYTLDYESQADQPGNPTMLTIHVPEGLDKPYHLRNTSLEEGTFVRIGSTSRKATKEELLRLIRKGQNLSFDKEEVQTPIKLNPSLLEEFLRKRKDSHGAALEPIHNELLLDLGLLTSSGNPTVGGVLLFTDRPQDLPGFEHATIKVARFKGREKGFFIDRDEIYGPLAFQLEATKKFVVKNIRLSGNISGLTRSDILEYPEDVIRELIVNAIVHRDYSRTGSSIMISIFDDRIEVTSPGGLEGGVSPLNIQNRQYSRNPIIARRMFDMGYFDSWGQGIDKIIRWSSERTKHPPLFEDAYDQFTITVYSPLEYPITEGSASGATSKDQLVLDLFRHATSISNQTIRQELGLSKTQAQSILKRLLAARRIVQRGRGRSTVYELKG